MFYLKDIKKYYTQTTGFTCGPAALMSAMNAASDEYVPKLEDEIKIWREANTVFMGSGHPGCCPVGLALSAHNRGFDTAVLTNHKNNVFSKLETHKVKKQIMDLNDLIMKKEAHLQNIPIKYRDFSVNNLMSLQNKGWKIIILVTHELDDEDPEPHWVYVKRITPKRVDVFDPYRIGSKMKYFQKQHVNMTPDQFDEWSEWDNLKTCVLVR